MAAGIIQVGDLPRDAQFDFPLSGRNVRAGALMLNSGIDNARNVFMAKQHPFKLGVSLGGGAGLPGIRAYSEWLGRDDIIAIDYFARAQWSDIESPNFIFDAWVPWQAAYPDNWIALAIPLLPDTLPATNAANWTAGAAGTNDAHFVTLANNIVASGLKNIIIRLHHEFNISGIPAGSAANWITYWKRVVNIFRGIFTTASGVKMLTCWNPSRDNGLNLDTFWPGSTEQYTATTFGGIAGTDLVRINTSFPFRRRYPCPEVDFIGLDTYDQSGSSYVANVQPTAAQWHEGFWSYLSNFDEFPHTAAFNTGSHNYVAKLSQETGTPLCIPEWAVWQVGLNGRPAGGDNYVFIRKMYEWFKTANVAWAGYFDYTNIPQDASHQLWPGVDNSFVTLFPKARDEYLRLF